MTKIVIMYCKLSGRKKKEFTWEQFKERASFEMYKDIKESDVVFTMNYKFKVERTI